MIDFFELKCEETKPNLVVHSAGLAGTIIYGCIVDILGRKIVMICVAIPQLIANILLIVGTNHYYIYCARFLFGMAAGGVFMMVPIFVAEISFER